jgi:hypothetical protein
MAMQLFGIVLLVAAIVVIASIGGSLVGLIS